MSEQYYKSQATSSYQNYNDYYDTDEDVIDELDENKLLFESEVSNIYEFIDDVRQDTVLPFFDKLTFESLLEYLGE